MSIHVCSLLVMIGMLATGALASFQASLDLIVKHHGRNETSLAHTVDTLTHIATKLKDEPEDKKYRSIRLLNKTFWERVGSVNGGISFMSALGFDLVEQGAGQGPSFKTRPGAPLDSDLLAALEALSANAAPKHDGDLGAAEDAGTGDSVEPSNGDKSGFNPFTTAFSRKSRTHLQERAEQGLAKFAEKQASRQQSFSTLEDRHVAILLPQIKSQREADASESETAEIEKESDADQRELELVAQLWRERQARDDFEGFETAAAKKLRLLRSAKMYPYVLLRVRLPGGVYLQARFTVDESLETVYQVVGESLAAEAGREDSDQQICHNFELFVAPPTRVLGRDSTSIKDAHVTPPACVLHLRWESEEAVVADWAKRLEDGMENVTSSSRHPRVPFSSRYDVPEPISSKRARSSHADAATTDAHRGDEGVAKSPAFVEEMTEPPTP